jgi:hypothetical protein
LYLGHRRPGEPGGAVGQRELNFRFDVNDVVQKLMIPLPLLQMEILLILQTIYDVG